MSFALCRARPVREWISGRRDGLENRLRQLVSVDPPRDFACQSETRPGRAATLASDIAAYGGLGTETINTQWFPVRIHGQILVTVHLLISLWPSSPWSCAWASRRCSSSRAGAREDEFLVLLGRYRGVARRPWEERNRR